MYLVLAHHALAQGLFHVQEAVALAGQEAAQRDAGGAADDVLWWVGGWVGGWFSGWVGGESLTYRDVFLRDSVAQHLPFALDHCPGWVGGCMEETETI